MYLIYLLAQDHLIARELRGQSSQLIFIKSKLEFAIIEVVESNEKLRLGFKSSKEAHFELIVKMVD